jgi:hypothetical protein
MSSRAGDADASDGSAWDDSVPLDAAETLRMIHETQDRARAANEPDGRLLYALWGLAWLLGYGLLWFSSLRTGGTPASWAFVAFGLGLAGAMAVTTVHSIRRSSGTRGVSARSGAMFGWAWFLGFVAYGFVMGGLGRAGASDEVMALAANAVACLVVGLLYLGGGACFQDLRLYLLGVWILVVAGIATFTSLPLTYAVMALAGGGGFLLLAAVEQALLVRRRRLSDAGPATVSHG